MVSIIRDSLNKRWKRAGRWVLVYGRRKAGKSFFIKGSTKWDNYFFVGRSKEIFEGEEKIPYEVFERVVFESLKNNKTVVIDEIQRLPEEFHDKLHAFGVRGNLIAVSSTLWIAKKLLGQKSPLLGLFSEFEVPLISEADVLKNLSEKIKGTRQLLEYSVYLREPWLIPLWEKSENFPLSMAADTKISVPALMGEIFSEEEKHLSSVYEGILKAISDGKRVSGEISGYLFSLKLIQAQDPSLVHPYLDSLNKLGIIEKIKVFGREKYFYYHRSPVTDLFYYMSEKYGFGEREMPDKQIENIIEDKLPLHVEQFFRDLLSKIFGLNKEIISEKDYEVDIVLTEFKKIKIVAEVKWRNKISESEIRKVENTLNRFDCRKILIVPNKKDVEREPQSIELWDMKDILKLVNSGKQ